MINKIFGQNFLNFSAGLTLGAIGSFMYQYSKFLYYTVFSIQTMIIFILINEIGRKKND